MKSCTSACSQIHRSAIQAWLRWLEVLEQVVRDMAAAHRNTQPVRINEHPDSQVVAQKQKHHQFIIWAGLFLRFCLWVLTVWIYFKDKGKREHDDMLRSRWKQARVEALRVLTELTDNPNVDIRVNALSAPSDSHDPAIQPALRKHLRFRSWGPWPPRLRWRSLQKNDSVTALRALMQQTCKHQGHDVRGTALMQPEIAQGNGSYSLRSVVRSGKPNMGGALLCGKRWPDATDLMRRCRGSAASRHGGGIEMLGCLASTGDASARDQLRGRTSEGPPGKVRIAAAARLLRSGDPLGAQLPLELSKKPAFEQLIAARALASPQYPETVALFRDLLQSDRCGTRLLQLAVEGIGEAGSSEHVTLLHPLLRSAKDDPLRLAAASAIIHIAGRDPALVSAQALAWAKQALSSLMKPCGSPRWMSWR